MWLGAAVRRVSTRHSHKTLLSQVTLSSVQSVQQMSTSTAQEASASTSLQANDQISSSVQGMTSSSASKADANSTNTENPVSERGLAHPISGVFAIVKPSGQTSMKLLDALKPLLASSRYFQEPAESDEASRGFNKKAKWGKRKRGGKTIGPSAPKIGQGGTLDPLADGVLVIGIGRGTKQLNTYLDCTKEYRTVALLGASTLSYDSDDPILLRRPHTHLSADSIRSVLPHFRGKGTQLPPLYSAVKIDGKRLFDYAREGLDLPRPIERRQIDVSHLELANWQAAGEHSCAPASRECNEEERTVALRARRLAGLDPAQEGASSSSSDAERADENHSTEAEDTTSTSDERDVAPAAFTLDMTVSSGTYVRSIVHDVGARAGSAAYVVRLTRTRQGKWVTPGYATGANISSSTETKEAIEWDVFAKALERLYATEEDGGAPKKRALENGSAETKMSGAAATESTDGPLEWERLILERLDRC